MLSAGLAEAVCLALDNFPPHDLCRRASGWTEAYCPFHSLYWGLKVNRLGCLEISAKTPDHPRKETLRAPSDELQRL